MKRGPGMPPIHGLYKSREYRLWLGIKARCHNPNHRGYANYGGRGIAMCEQWRRDFTVFLRDMGGRPGPGFQLDRIDNNRGYEPGNVRWATRAEQDCNKRTNVFLELDGVRLTQAQWARRLGIAHNTLGGRLARGWPLRDALTSPKVNAGRGAR